MKALLLFLGVAAFAISGAEAGNGRQLRQGNGQCGGQEICPQDGQGNQNGEKRRVRAGKRNGECNRDGGCLGADCDCRKGQGKGQGRGPGGGNGQGGGRGRGR